MRAESAQIVLLVDGEVLVRHALAEYLRDCGYVVVEAASTDEAATVLQSSDLAIYVALCDAVAPGTRNGFAFASWVRSEWPDLPVLLAGSIDKAAAAAGELCEEGPQLARPYDPSSVVDRIRRRVAARSRR
jgi:CheY-like chemotaxis protein